MKNEKAEKAVKKKERDIGLGLSQPKEECDDSKCAWHGKLSVRGRVFRGKVKSAKAHSTAIVEWGYHRLSPKYQRYERRKSRVTAHNPPCMKAKEGDQVIIAECRSISKTKNFVIVNVERGGK